MCAADSLTDHRLVVSKLPQPKNPTCTTTTIQESSKETGCFQVEKKTARDKLSSMIFTTICVQQCNSVPRIQKRTGHSLEMRFIFQLLIP